MILGRRDLINAMKLENILASNAIHHMMNFIVVAPKDYCGNQCHQQYLSRGIT
jgi:hypothetical protein